jgi:hypothetical protein
MKLERACELYGLKPQRVVSWTAGPAVTVTLPEPSLQAREGMERFLQRMREFYINPPRLSSTANFGPFDTETLQRVAAHGAVGWDEYA